MVGISRVIGWNCVYLADRSRVSRSPQSYHESVLPYVSFACVYLYVLERVRGCTVGGACGIVNHANGKWQDELRHAAVDSDHSCASCKESSPFQTVDMATFRGDGFLCNCWKQRRRNELFRTDLYKGIPNREEVCGGKLLSIPTAFGSVSIVIAMS